MMARLTAEPGEGRISNDVVPFARFFAVVGYTIVSFFAIVVLSETAGYIALGLYHTFLFSSVLPGPQYQALFGHCPGVANGKCHSFPDLDTNISSGSYAYNGEAWAEDFWKEERVRNAQEEVPYEPFRMWGMMRLHGKYVTTEDTPMGTLRKTVSSMDPACAIHPQRKVWVFGGSTVWGDDLPDSATLPSYLSRKLNAGPTRCVEVTNLGVDGYNGNQEVLFLLQQLKAGLRPDVIVFYDGANDTTVGATEPSLPTTHWGYSLIKMRLESGPMDWGSLIRNSNSFRVVNGILRKLQRAKDQHPTEQELAIRAQATLENYGQNVRVVQELARAFSFKAYFFWQPALYYGHKQRDLFEEGIMSLQAEHIMKTEATVY